MQPKTDISKTTRRSPRRKSSAREHFQAALLELAKLQLDDLSGALREILKKDGEALGVERVSAWFFDPEFQIMTCRELYQKNIGFHGQGLVLEATNYPRYFQAMREQRVIAAGDARRHPQTSEFTESYMKPLGIMAMLDIPLWHGGQMVGVLCHEHTGSLRDWTVEEQDFAASIADFISRALGSAERASAERVKAAIIEAALDCIVVMDDHGRIREFNPAAEKTFGFRREEVLGKLLAETIVPERYRQAHEAGIKRLIETGEARLIGRRVELNALRADGKEFPCELTISLTNVEGRPLFAAYLRDISARVCAQQRQAAQLAVTRVLADSATLAEAAPRLLQAVCENLDWGVGAMWRAGDYDGLGCLELWTQDEAAYSGFIAATRRQKFSAGEGLPGRIWASGEPVWLPDFSGDMNLPRLEEATTCGLKSAFGFPIRIGPKVLGVVEFFSAQRRDIDAELLAIFAAIGAQLGLFIERRAAEEELRLLNADLERRVSERTRELGEANVRIQAALAQEQELGMLKSNFIATVTHEFRTPLGVILSSAEMLQNYFDRLTAEDRNEQLQTISEAVQRMADLMEEVLLFHKVEGGVSELNAEVHDLESLCRQIANEVVSATAHRCEIEAKIAPLPQARFDGRLLRHILVNLLNNAIKYSESGCTVSLGVKRDGADVVITVRDQGIGIAAEDMQRLFVPFRRGSNVGQRAGTGLGLSIAKRCVDLHGGTLEFRSRIGEGTTATLRLPVFKES